MTVSIPVVAILGAIVYVAWRYIGLRVWQAIVCLLFGFYLAGTDAAPDIRRLVAAAMEWLTGS